MAFDPWFHDAGGAAPPPPPPNGVPQSGAAGGAAPGWGGSFIDWMNQPVVTTPDYQSLINQYTAPYESIASQQQALAQQQFDALRQNISQQRGFAQNAYGITNSGYSEAHQEAARSIINNLAARGILNSGERGYQRGRENRRFGRQTGLARNSLQSLLAGLAYQQQQAQFGMQASNLASQGQLAGLRSQAANYVQQAYQPTVTHPNAGYLPGGLA